MRHNLSNFLLKQLCSHDDPDTRVIRYKISDVATGKVLVLAEKPVKIFATPIVTIKYLPTVISRTGLPWDTACYYLTEMAVNQTADPSSIKKYAVNLFEYYDFCTDNEIDPMLDTPSKRKKPVSRFKNHLIGKVMHGEITDKTANNKISNVVRFYRWLVDDYGHIFIHRPFNNDSLLIQYQKHNGAIGHKLVQSHNARIKSSPTSNLLSEGVILDGAHLRPLSPEEQIDLIDILAKSPNTEMLLIHLFSLTTGARIQSVLTLRHKHFRIDNGDKPLPLAIGFGTDIDSKCSKKQVLVVPSFIQKKLGIYSHSDRAKKRFLKYCEKRQIEPTKKHMEACQLFLTVQGNPFYDSKKDLYKHDPSQNRTNARDGDAVRQFITSFILPKMREKYGASYHYKFHDLRATFGLNLADACMKLVNKNEMQASEVLPFVMSRMNHTDEKTTQLYLDYRQKNAQVQQIISEYQNNMLDRIEIMLGQHVT